MKETEPNQEMPDSHPECAKCSWIAAIIIGVSLIVGTTPSDGLVYSQTALADSKTQPIGLDTSQTPAIPARSCRMYDWYIEPDSTGKAKIRAVNFQYISSLHALTCQWGVMTQALSLDSTQLPRYVQIMSDTLHLSEDAFAYAVRLTPTENGPRRIENTIYFVANIADSLYYHDLGDEHRRQRHFNRTWIRSLRTLDVPRATSRYIWVETGNRSVYRTDTSTTTRRGWVGNILAYDTTQGFRYLSSAPIRAERAVNGDFKGMEQWDVAVPEPGIMTIGVRERKGEVVEDSPFFASPDWLGPHVIDPEAVSDSSEYRYLLEEPGILDR